MAPPATDRIRKESLLRAPRFQPKNELSIQAKTLGTSIDYGFSACNLSRTGLLIRQNHSFKVPFLVNTLVEILIDSKAEWFSQPIECIGKVVRIVPDKSMENMPDQFGVQIVQIDKPFSDTWDKSIDELLETLGFSPEPFIKTPRLVS